MYNYFSKCVNVTLISILNLVLSLCLVILIPLLIAGCDSSNDKQQHVKRKVPNSLVAKAGARSVNLSWGDVAGADAYTLYYSNNPNVSRSDSAVIQATRAEYQHVPMTINGVFTHEGSLFN